MFGKKNKKGWIKILEAFIAILFLIGILTAVVVKANFRDDTVADKIYEFERSILQEIEINQTLRNEVLDTTPIKNSNETGFSSLLNSTLRNKTPSSLNCELVICPETGTCFYEGFPSSKEIYAHSVIIVANYNQYSPKKLNLFCWLK